MAVDQFGNTIYDQAQGPVNQGFNTNALLGGMSVQPQSPPSYPSGGATGTWQPSTPDSVNSAIDAGQQYGMFGQNTGAQQSDASQALKQLVQNTPTVNGRPTNWATGAQEAGLTNAIQPHHAADNTFADIVAGGLLAGTGAGALGYGPLAGAFGEDASALGAGALGDAASSAVPDTGALLNTGDIGAAGGAADATAGAGALPAGFTNLSGSYGIPAGATDLGDSMPWLSPSVQPQDLAKIMQNASGGGGNNSGSSPNWFGRNVLGQGQQGGGANSGTQGGQSQNSQQSNLPPALQAITGALQVAQGIKGLPGMTTQAQIQKNLATSQAAQQAYSDKSIQALMAAANKSSSMPRGMWGTNPGLNFANFAKGGSVKSQSGARSGGGDGQADDVPANLSSGEYVIPADVVSHLGSGNNDAGSSALDTLVQNARTHRASHGTKLPPKAKNPMQYIGDSK